MIQTADEFISRWQRAGASERANYQMFLSELCDVIGVPRPEPSQADDTKNSYVFEKTVHAKAADGSSELGRIDLYKRGCFVLEAKQGADDSSGRLGHGVRGSSSYDVAMIKAKQQAEDYVHALPASEGWIPFVVVVDVGSHVELYSDFSRSGRNHEAFPDPGRRKIMLADLKDEETRSTLCKVWTDPASLDPALQSVKVTKELAASLAELAKSLEKGGHSPQVVAAFLQRALFTMFAEDVKLLPERSFTTLLKDLTGEPGIAREMLADLWQSMDKGTFSTIIRKRLPRFNGGLFVEATVPELTTQDIALLIKASEADWSCVEPAIFGTLLERALDPRERHKLGAHYTPRPYVERLVEPTIMEDLRNRWKAVKAEVERKLESSAKKSEKVRQKTETECIGLVKEFHRSLCQIRVLDPACGSGNFLYVAFELIKRLEADVVQTLAELGFQQSALALESGEFTVDPHQFLGIEINPRAAALADLVLWIGHLQWHFKTYKDAAPREPVLHNYGNIVCRDALLEYAHRSPRIDANGNEIRHWDGFTTKLHPVTNEQIPDETATVAVFEYHNPGMAPWPVADYIVGNPPFIGGSTMRSDLGDGYVEALRSTYASLPDSIDFVMYWWHRAAEYVRTGQSRRFGFITTNSIKQALNRRVIQLHQVAEPRIFISFAIPDHPWVDSSDGAAVRIGMTVASLDSQNGQLGKVAKEILCEDGACDVLLNWQIGVIHADLSIGANLVDVVSLGANSGLCFRGHELGGAGFIVTKEETEALSSGSTIPVIKPYLNGRDLTDHPRGVNVIDLNGLTIEQVQSTYPAIYQRLWEKVWPERQQNRNEKLRREWWLHRGQREELRAARKGTDRTIVTVETSKHRTFQFLPGNTIPDNKLVCITIEDAFILGVLSSRVHVTWAIATGSNLGVGNDPVYVKSRCFDPFPFPVCSEEIKERIRTLAERLDNHRKRQQELHSGLTLTGMYNVLEKIKIGEALSAKDKKIHEDGLVAVLYQLHKDLDAAVADAYGWPANLSEQEILERLVALNEERQDEEKRGIIRWLRPDYQAPASAKEVTHVQLSWPVRLKDQISALRTIISEYGKRPSVCELMSIFPEASMDKIEEVLEAVE